jgi:hypothetical protein
MDIHSQKEAYIEQAVKIELGEIEESSESDRTTRLRFWQSLTSADRMAATTEIVRRVHIARGGKIEDLKVKKDFVRVVRR